MSQPHVRHTQIRMEIPMRQWDAWADLSEFTGGMLEFFEQSRTDWPRFLQEANPIQISLHVLRLGEAAICFNPAELYVHFGLAIKKRSPACVTLVAQLTNGYCGYVPTPEAIRHGGYSATAASHTRLVAEAGWMMVENTRQLLAQAFDERVVPSTPANSPGK